MSGMPYDIPQEDTAEFGGLREPTRLGVRKLLRIMRELMPLEGRRGIGDAIKRLASAHGMGPSTLRTHFDNYRHSQCDWRELIDWKVEGRDGRPGLPDWVVDFWVKLCEENNRKMEPAHRALVRAWHAGYIPPEAPAGSKWPEYDPDTALPRGCSLGNLRGKYRPSDFGLNAMRHGLGMALAKNGPKILTTRVGAWVGSHYNIDDVKRDMEFLLMGHGGQRVCPLELGALDVFSGHRFAVHRQPQYVREDGKKDGIKERETRFFMASIFRNFGYSPRGTEMVTELGTAVLRDALLKFFAKHSNEKITRRQPGIVGREQAIAGYFGSGGGNPRHKRIESHHNLLQSKTKRLACWCRWGTTASPRSGCTACSASPTRC
ncbi:MAG: hypothetical protein P4L99_21820 [Chthoniobacter sp.]|nr:hypothetical protein [Chthoniobacter sp.]